MEHLVLTGCAVLATLGLAAWQVPPLLDWSKYKSIIATYASARLGRHVTIGGQVRLTVLPRATLMADDVTLADRGDGVSAKIGTLRLEVSLAHLLTGRVLPRALAIERPVVSLPWPLPRGAAPGMRPSLRQDFTATMDDGTVKLGGIAFHAISASFRTDPDTGAFDAQGAAVVAGLPWRFTALAGAPGGDGVSPLSLTLDGMSSNARPPAPGMLGTGGAFHGRILHDGSIAGTLALRGPDASRLGDAPAVPWQISGDVRGTASDVIAPSVDLTLGTSPGHAAIAFHLAAARVDVTARVGALAGGDWLLPFLHRDAASAPMLAADWDLSVGAMTLAGETLRTLHVTLSRGAAATTLRALSVILPGGARVEATGQLADGDAFTGHARIVAPDLRRLLHVAAGGALDGLPPGVLSHADLAGVLMASDGHAALTVTAGHVDDSLVNGILAVGFGRRPTVGLDLTLDQVGPASWLAAPDGTQITVAQAVAAAGQVFSRFDATIRVHADRVVLPGLVLRHAGLDAEAGRDGMQIHGVDADLPGGHVEASGRLGDDGTLTDGRLDLVAPDAALLPAAWRRPENLWRGGLHLAVNAAGPPQDMAAQMRADLGDLRAEAEAHVDAPAGRMTATVTLRHPGAPRLLAAVGVHGAESWLENGSLAVLAHLTISPWHVRADDFSVSAAALQLAGGFDLDLTGAVPVIDGHAEAGTLALPGLPTDGRAPLPWDLLRHIQADFRLKAAQVLSNLRPVAENASATVSIAGGDVLIDDVQAGVAGGALTGTLALDSLRDPPLVALQAREDGAVPDAIGPAGLTLSGGTSNAAAELAAQGYSPWALAASCSGYLAVAAHGVSIDGLDLASLQSGLLAARSGLRAALESALTGGGTAGMDGAFEGPVSDGVLHVSAGHFVGTAGDTGASGATGSTGKVGLTGSFDGPQGLVDLRLSILPAVAAPPVLRLRLAGPYLAPVRQTDISPGLAWAGQARKPPPHSSRSLRR